MTTLLRTPAPRVPRPEAPAARSLLGAVGRTPLLRLDHLAAALPDAVQVFAKAEHLNPGGSVKDRAALRMVRQGLRSGAFRPGTTLLDATSGNTGVAYALLGAALGFRVCLALPANASQARQDLLRSYGAELILTDPLEGTDGAQQTARSLVKRHPERYFYPDQYNNEANWQAHFYGTGIEILEQTGGHLTHFVAALGTTGTFTGTARRLKWRMPAVRCSTVQPDSPLHGLEGVKHLPTARVPGIFDPSLVDETATVSTEEALAMTRALAREEGLLVGPSSGANVAAALRVARRLGAGAVVTILCDTGTRYLGDAFWDDP